MLTEFGGLSTPLVADACIRSGVPLRVAPPGIGAVVPGQRVAGRALPTRHYGSVDVFLEAFSGAAHGDVLVVDNGGREDEACVGDLVVLEAQAAGVSGLIVWGLHRDTAELTQIALPVFSYGRCPAGPVRLDEQEPSALASARSGSGHAWSPATTSYSATTTAWCSSRPARLGRSWPQPGRSARSSGIRPVRSRRVRPCATRQPSATTWRGGKPNRPTRSGGTCGRSAVPSKSRHDGQPQPATRPDWWSSTTSAVS